MSAPIVSGRKLLCDTLRSCCYLIPLIIGGIVVPGGCSRREVIISSPRTPAEARTAFYEQGAQLGLFTTYPEDRVMRLKSGEQWSARRLSYRTAYENVQSAYEGLDKPTVFYFGTDETLNRQGECWEVSDSGGYHGIRGYLDADSGRLIFVWVPPEG